ncbi:MAG: sigma-70 family RNA polymerase sigma factor [Pirellulales bacterium]
MLAQDEQTVVARGLRDGDPAAWTALYDGFSVEVWRYVARLLGSDAASVADVVQETFLGAARSARQFDPACGTLAGWLFGIAHRQVALHWRQRGRRQRLQQAAESAAEESRRLLDAADPTAELSDRRELTDMVRSVLAELSADYAALLIGKYLDQRTLADLCSKAATRKKR